MRFSLHETLQEGCCPNSTSVPAEDEDGSPVIENGKLIFVKRYHTIVGKGVVTCTQCNTSWCCMECAIECDALDHQHYDQIDERDKDEPTPDVFPIICCKCSGKNPCWTDRED